jgi:hypothetical protein
MQNAECRMQNRLSILDFGTRETSSVLDRTDGSVVEIAGSTFCSEAGART